MPTKLNSEISVPSLPSYDEPVSVPSLPSHDEPVGHIFDENQNSENATNNNAHLHSSLSPVATTAEDMQAENQECMESKMKDELIEMKDVQIKNLQNRLKKAQKKIWYLENVKKKLNDTLSGLKRTNLINEELHKKLEVSIYVICCQIWLSDFCVNYLFHFELCPLHVDYLQFHLCLNQCLI